MLDFVLKPWHLLTLYMAAELNREQQRAIEYLQTENQVLREKLGKKRILLNDDQRRRLAVKGKELGRKGLRELTTIVTPDTILRWHRELIARKWDYSNRKTKVGRPPTSVDTVELVLRMAHENPGWGYDRIEGALKNMGIKLSDTTVGNILRDHGIEPAPDRGKRTTWKTFLKAHWEVFGAADLTTVEVWTCRGLVTYYILVVMQLSTRRIEIAGVTPNPDAAWMHQVARNLTDFEDGFLLDTRYLLLDRDTKFLPFTFIIESSDTKVVLLPPRSPNLNACVERFMRSIKSECLDKMVLFGERSLRNALKEFSAHYHHERNHQGLGNNIIEFHPPNDSVNGPIQNRERLGGMLRYYYRDAA